MIRRDVWPALARREPEQVAFSPDGRYLYYPREVPGSRTRDATLVRRRLVDGIEDVVFNAPGRQLYTVLVLTPDGETFATLLTCGATAGVYGSESQLSVWDLPALIERRR